MQFLRCPNTRETAPHMGWANIILSQGKKSREGGGDE